MSKKAEAMRIAVLGASGYTGAELLRILVRHPNATLAALTADRRAGESVATVFPHLDGLGLPRMVRVEDVDFSGIDTVFCCLPHGETQETVAALPGHLKILDLSADFRLADPETYAEWYGHPHRAKSLQKEAVYGLTELAREAIPNARLIACPGCYPTSALLPLMPLLEAGLVEADDIVIDSKSGVTGAGRSLKEESLFAEVAEGIHAYGVGRHRHVPEIEQGLSRAAGKRVTVSFTPHLVPMNRGILSTVYVRLGPNADADDLRAALQARYKDERFVRVVPDGTTPATHHVRGSNVCLIGVFPDRRPDRAILISALDNLVKGASGQAVQNFNLVSGVPEATGLEQEPLFP
ncbi:MAG: N-acetyl-gamma-glutamyl-phosphate reductase [Alphaproteobacteria bacterium]|nr:N-acetyl-gamma-glutamyl-phosphate reductase [Alphaproteobacteria bacterium]